MNYLLTATFLIGLLLTGVTQARTFHNSDGKSIEAKLISVEGTEVSIKLTNGRIVKVDMDKFSTTDQSYIKTWWEKNKNLLTESDVQFSIRQQNYYTKKPNTKTLRKGNIIGRTKTSESEYIYLCDLNNYSSKTVKGIKATYSVHKRVTKRGKNGSSSEVEIITNTLDLDTLNSKSRLKFNTDGVKCRDMSNSITDEKLRETIIGMVLTLSVNGKEILTQSHPENFMSQLEEEEARKDRKYDEDSIREEQKDIAESRRGEDEQGRKYREDRAREKRKRDKAAAVAKRKAEEEAARNKNKKRADRLK